MPGAEFATQPDTAKPKRVGKALPTSTSGAAPPSPAHQDDEWWWDMALSAEPFAAVFLPCDPAAIAVSRLVCLDAAEREEALAGIRDQAASAWRAEMQRLVSSSDAMRTRAHGPVDIAVVTTTPAATPLDTLEMGLAVRAVLEGTVAAGMLPDSSISSVRTCVLQPPDATDERPPGLLIELWAVE